MPHFPIEYSVELQKGTTSPMELRAGHRPVLLAGPPPEFKGGDTWWSPEHLDRTADGVAFASMLLVLDLHVLFGEGERARKLVAQAKDQCFIAKTLRCPVDVSVTVTAS